MSEPQQEQEDEQEQEQQQSNFYDLERSFF